MTADFAAERTTMVDSQVRPHDVTDLTLIDAMRHVARHALVPPSKARLAYADAEIEYAPGRWMLSPRDVAKLLQALKPRSGDRALAIAAPYAGAVLEWLGLVVTRRDAAGAIVGDFDLAICEGAVTRAPAAWLDALASGGRLGVVERRGPVGRAMLYSRDDGDVGSRPLFDSTPPLLRGFEPSPTFVF